LLLGSLPKYKLTVNNQVVKDGHDYRIHWCFFGNRCLPGCRSMASVSRQIRSFVSLTRGDLMVEIVLPVTLAIFIS